MGGVTGAGGGAGGCVGVRFSSPFSADACLHEEQDTQWLKVQFQHSLGNNGLNGALPVVVTSATYCFLSRITNVTYCRYGMYELYADPIAVAMYAHLSTGSVVTHACTFKMGSTTV